jgi:hypothetical protein
MNRIRLMINVTIVAIRVAVYVAIRVSVCMAVGTLAICA